MPQGKLHPITGCQAHSLVNCIWLIEPQSLQSVVDMAMSYDLKDVMAFNEDFDKKNPTDENALPYAMQGDVAVIEVSGVMTRHPTSFQKMMGGASYNSIAGALHHAKLNGAVRAIVLKMSTPGGQTDGMFDAMESIKKVCAHKDVYTYAEDVCASAGQALAVATKYIAGNVNAKMGSVGTMTYLMDSSEQFTRQGIKVIPIVTGKMKGLGIPGAKITDAQIRYAQDQVNSINDLFVKAVVEGRGISEKNVRDQEARVYVGSNAVSAGLMDEVCGWDDFLQKVQAGTVPVRKPAPQGQKAKNMLTQEQLVAAAKLPGVKDITAENADTVLLSAMMELQTKFTSTTEQLAAVQGTVPVKIDANLAKGHVALAEKALTFLEKSETVLPTQLAVLKEHVKPENVSASGEIMVPFSAVTKILEENKPMGLTKVNSAAQPAGKVIPGEGKKDDDKPTLASVNAARQAAGLKLHTPAEFNSLYPA